MGRRILITGAGRGIGRAIATHLAAEGAELLLVGRNLADLETSAESVRKAGGSAKALVGDVTDRPGLRALAADLQDLDGLVANAGISGVTPVEGNGESDELFDRILATDLTGPWNTVRAFLPRMGRGGRIVLVSSVLGRFGVPGYGGYCAAKHGLLGLTKALALELAPQGIFVNAVAPGWVDTDMAATGIGGMAHAMGVAPAEARRRAERAVPAGRFFQPEEIARGVAWMLDPANTMQIGQCLNLDGGVVQV
ncbi:MAG TPA: SDR family oxidoreductase [Holophagaceae bacterium]|nr:SDR family oxidoreductase [Holophagaceae bacterium]